MTRGKSVFESKGLSGQEAKVEAIKEKAAALWDEIDSVTVSPEAGRLVALAKTELEMAVMWAVKACSRSQLVVPCDVPAAPEAAVNQPVATPPTSSEVAQAVTEAAEGHTEGSLE